MTEISHTVLGIIDEEPSDVEAEVEPVETESAGPETEQDSSQQVQPDETPPEVEAQTGTEDVPPEQPAQVSEPFKFLGKEWESIAKAEEVLGSQEGRISKLNESNALYAQRLNEYWEYIQAVDAELKELRSKATQEPAKESEEKAVSEDDEEEWYQTVRTAMELGKSRGIDPLEVAIQAVNQRFEKKLNDKLESRLAEATQPIRELEENRAETEAQTNLFVWGQKQGYPELQRESLDQPFVAELYKTFKSLAAQYPQFAYSGTGFDYAYRLTKDHYAPASAQAATPGSAPQPARDEKGRFIGSNAAASAASDMSGTTADLNRPKPDEVQEMLQSLGKIKPITVGETNLGFFE